MRSTRPFGIWCAHEKRLLGICATERQQVLSFLLRHGRIFTGHRHWSRAHLRWLAGQAFNHPAQQIVFQDQVDAAADAQARLERLDHQLAELVPTWSMAPVVAARQAMRGVSFLVAVTLAEMGMCVALRARDS